MSETYTTEAATLDDSIDVDKIVLYALDEAAEKLEQGGELEPFTVILHGGNLHIESYPGEDAIDCFTAATAAVKALEHVMDAYVFAYDGYLSTDDGTLDAIIVERGKPNEEQADAFAVLYTIDEEGDGSLTFEEGIYDLGPANSLFADTPITSEDLEEI